MSKPRLPTTFLLTLCSDQGGSCMGVVLGGRTPSQAGQACAKASSYNKRQTRSQEGSRQHCKLLQEGIEITSKALHYILAVHSLQIPNCEHFRCTHSDNEVHFITFNRCAIFPCKVCQSNPGDSQSLPNQYHVPNRK